MDAPHPRKSQGKGAGLSRINSNGPLASMLVWALIPTECAGIYPNTKRVLRLLWSYQSQSQARTRSNFDARVGGSHLVLALVPHPGFACLVIAVQLLTLRVLRPI